MFKTNKPCSSKIDTILKYFIFYSIFIFFVVSGSSSNILLKTIPDMSVTLIFFKFLWNEDMYPPINLFILGLIIDTYTFVPLFLSSFCLLLSYKITLLLKNFLVSDKYFIYLVRDSSIFIVLFFTLKWFVLSYYNSVFFSFYDTILNIIFNIIYCAIIYIIYNKTLNND